jgi:phage terminase large subunit
MRSYNQTELLNSHLATSLITMPKAPIVADSAEPKSIAKLQQHALNVIPCEKGADSVYFGIKHVQGLPISYTRRSTNLHKEYENYAWKVNKDGETVGIEDPKCANHAMSAIATASQPWQRLVLRTIRDGRSESGFRWR